MSSPCPASSRVSLVSLKARRSRCILGPAQWAPMSWAGGVDRNDRMNPLWRRKALAFDACLLYHDSERKVAKLLNMQVGSFKHWSSQMITSEGQKTMDFGQ